MQQQQGARDPVAVRQQTAGSTDFQPTAAPMAEHAQMGTSGREGARPSEGTDREDHRSPRSHDE